MSDWVSNLIVVSIPFLIPGYLIASWLYNHRPSDSVGHKKEKSQSKPEEQSEDLSDSSMTK